MLIVEIKNGENIEKSLKTLKSKVIKTKQNQILFERKEYKKKSHYLSRFVGGAGENNLANSVVNSL